MIITRPSNHRTSKWAKPNERECLYADPLGVRGGAQSLFAAYCGSDSLPLKRRIGWAGPLALRTYCFSLFFRFFSGFLRFFEFLDDFFYGFFCYFGFTDSKICSDLKNVHV
jgi:hypothetical protein